ncbi:MAG: linear amide C-N hydrolase, partial [Clostridium sp.]
KAIVVEFINKEIKIYENDFGVLTNSPEFPVQLINLGNYTNLDKYCRSTVKFGDRMATHLGQGSGALGLPGDMTPMSRFVRASFLTENAHYDDNTVVDTAFHILNSFDIVAGSTCQHMPSEMIKKMGKFLLPVSEDGVTEITQFTLVKDLTNGIMYVKDINDQNIRRIELSKLNLKENGKKLRMPLAIKREYEDVTTNFK